jgi:hypothetical protein
MLRRRCTLLVIRRWVHSEDYGYQYLFWEELYKRWTVTERSHHSVVSRLFVLQQAMWSYLASFGSFGLQTGGRCCDFTISQMS